MLTLEYHLMLSKQLAADKLLKKTYMTHLFSFMNYTMLVLPPPSQGHTQLLALSCMVKKNKTKHQDASRQQT